MMVKWHGHSPRPGVEGIVRIEAKAKGSKKKEVLWAQPVLTGRRRTAVRRALRVLHEELTENDYYGVRYEAPRITYEATEDLT